MGFVLKTIWFCTNKLYVCEVHQYYTILPDTFSVEIFQKILKIFWLLKVADTERRRRRKRRMTGRKMRMMTRMEEFQKLEAIKENVTLLQKCTLKMFWLFSNRQSIHIYSLKLYRFSYQTNPMCIITCLFKLLLEEDAYSHWLHLFDFSPLCLPNLPAWVDA